MNYRLCIGCSGEGAVQCPICKSLSSENHDCHTCHGTGHIVCAMCGALEKFWSMTTVGLFGRELFDKQDGRQPKALG